MMDILEKGYPDDEHVLVFDNAITHLKQEEDALSAMKMPKFTPKLGKNWGVEVVELDEDCNIVHGTERKVFRMQIRMTNAKFADGVASILEERSFTDMFKLKAQCKDFKCASDATCCCCHHILYTWQPDFVDVPSKLKMNAIIIVHNVISVMLRDDDNAKNSASTVACDEYT
ncbi:hypothetical protein PILCRDRAFT_798871 [Piloderma croceum F 1598]|uniref:Uncharacterized protein n=1 Tax=Piloderma croceum (strain F 1598) TaxID=765440 RepID=A0A0C3ESJ2_PILCF|nr:hypothetical protein PILCRDRAFT_798871 [Piloderma croceum F 1598]